MRYVLPPVDVKLVVQNDVHIKLRYQWLSNYYRNKLFYAVHSGWRSKNPTKNIWEFDLTDMYGSLNLSDSISGFVPLTIPRGTILRIAKLALGKNSGTRHVNLVITKTHNKHTHWDLPTIYLSIPVEDLTLFDLEVK